jgi:hypothetical protein
MWDAGEVRQISQDRKRKIPTSELVPTFLYNYISTFRGRCIMDDMKATLITAAVVFVAVLVALYVKDWADKAMAEAAAKA